MGISDKLYFMLDVSIELPATHQEQQFHHHQSIDRMWHILFFYRVFLTVKFIGTRKIKFFGLYFSINGSLIDYVSKFIDFRG